MRALLSRPLVVTLLVAGLAAAGVGGQPVGAVSDDVALEWKSPLVNASGHALDVAWGPELGGVTLFSRRSETGRQLVVQRWSKDGERRWTRKWAGPRSRVTRVLPEAVTASSWKAAIYVAGNATCRYGASERGPYFIRKYGVHGKVLWTRWDGRCPRQPGGHLPRPSKVTGLDVMGESLVISANHGAFCCEDPVVDGFVDLYGLGGRKLWRRNVEVPAYTDTNEAVLAVDVGVSEILVGGWVEAEPRDALSDEIDKEGFAMALVPWQDGKMRWVQLAEDTGPADVDAYTVVGHGGQRVFFGGVLDQPISGGQGTTFVEQRNSGDGSLLWDDILPAGSSITSVDGLGNDASIVTGVAVQAGNDALLFRRYLPDGVMHWSTTWGAASRSFDLAAFSMNRKSGLGVGHVTDPDTGDVTSVLWKWRW